MRSELLRAAASGGQSAMFCVPNRMAHHFCMDNQTGLLGYRDVSTYQTALRRFEWPMLGLSVLFVIVLVIPEIMVVSADVRRVLAGIEAIIWTSFAAELAVLLWTAPHKRQALRDHWLDAIIVAAPFLRPLRIGRLLRVVRTTSILGRAGVAIRDVTARRGLRGFTAVAVVLICGLGLLTWAFERQATDTLISSPGEGLWWALVTSTTVGYGDLYPTTPEGRVIAGLLMVVGVAMLSVITASVAAYFVERDTEDPLARQIAALEQKIDVLTSELMEAS